MSAAPFRGALRRSPYPEEIAEPSAERKRLNALVDTAKKRLGRAQEALEGTKEPDAAEQLTQRDEGIREIAPGLTPACSRSCIVELVIQN